ncbi:MAG TPA: CHASE3 domain-containing protein, partial [Ktedonobacteraceae bacterium]|nr:CHASE3 domain-containing protein [Ktedonobacteraceae bacterium]
MKGLKPAFSANQEPRLLDQLRNRLFLIIGLLLLCFVFSVGISVYAVYSQQQLGAQKVRIHDDIDALLQSMVDQETGLRGYVSTNSTTFLDPYTNGHTQYSAILQRLNNETAGANFRATATALTVVDEK